MMEKKLRTKLHQTQDHLAAASVNLREVANLHSEYKELAEKLAQAYQELIKIQTAK